MSGPGGRAVVLLERERDLGAIDELLDDARQRSGRALLLQGEAGTGKTELLAAARRQATARGLRCLFARGGELERHFAFGVVRQLFERAVVGAPDDERSELFAGAARVARGLFESAEAADGEGAPPSAGALLHGLYWLSANLAEREPLLIAVDDMHWSDEASLHFLAYLVRRIEGLPIAVVGGARPAEPGVDLAALEPLQGEPLVDVVAVGGLSEEATAELLNEALEGVNPAFVHAAHAATRGNPFLVRELAAHMSAQGIRPTEVEARRLETLGPPSVGRTVAARVERLPDPAPALARAVAALGAGAELRHAAQLAEITVGDAAAAADDLTAIGVLAPGRPLEFVHPLVRSACMRTYPPASARVRTPGRRGSWPRMAPCPSEWRRTCCSPSPATTGRICRRSMSLKRRPRRRSRVDPPKPLRAISRERYSSRFPLCGARTFSIA